MKHSVYPEINRQLNSVYKVYKEHDFFNKLNNREKNPPKRPYIMYIKYQSFSFLNSISLFLLVYIYLDLDYLLRLYLGQTFVPLSSLR